MQCTLYMQLANIRCDRGGTEWAMMGLDGPRWGWMPKDLRAQDSSVKDTSGMLRASIENQTESSLLVLRTGSQ